LGRWISEDPIGFWGGDYNLSRYVQNDATGWVDPFGFDSVRFEGNEVYENNSVFSEEYIGRLSDDKRWVTRKTDKGEKTASIDRVRAEAGKWVQQPSWDGWFNANDKDKSRGMALPGGAGGSGFGDKSKKSSSQKSPNQIKQCDVRAKQIQRKIGGDIHRITPKRGQTLGKVKGEEPAWPFHDVVVKNGRVYDDMTGPSGVPIDAYKKFFEYGSDILFPF